MAIIEITVDTSKKTVVAKVDNKKISNVHDIHVFTETSGFFGVDIAQVEDVGDLKKITRLVACESREDGESIEDGENTEKATRIYNKVNKIDDNKSVGFKYIEEVTQGLHKYEVLTFVQNDLVSLENLLDKA